MLLLRSILFIITLSQVVSVEVRHTTSQCNFKNQSAALKSPIVFIPGDGGTQILAKLDKPARVHYICDLKSDWFDIWLNVHLLVPLAIDCFVDNMKLNYNFTDRKSYNSPGVDIRATSFGSLDSVDYLDILKLPKTQYFTAIIDKLAGENGYQRNIDMVGAGYDFRKAPNEMDEYFVNLTNLIETTFIENCYEKVTLICHSMGCLNTVHLLNRMTQDWKDTHIRRLISIAAPWGGSFKAISAMLFGDNLGVYVLKGSTLQQLQSTFPSLTYLFPVEPVFAKDRVLIQTKSKNYSLNNFDEFFMDRNLYAQHAMWNDTKLILQNLTAPGVELWCLYSGGVETPSKLVFSGSITDDTATEITSDGDGTVNIESLSSCTKWRKDQKQPIYTHQFDGLDHIDVLRLDSVASFIARKIMTITGGSNDDLLKQYLRTEPANNDTTNLKPCKYSLADINHQISSD